MACRRIEAATRRSGSLFGAPVFLTFEVIGSRHRSRQISIVNQDMEI
jgi:hypothetical protein